MKIIIHGSRGSYPLSFNAQEIEKLAQNIWQKAKNSKASNWQSFKKDYFKQTNCQSFAFGGATTCIEVIDEENLPMPIFFDAGTGISQAQRNSSSSLKKSEFQLGAGQAALFFTHTHWDHIIGLPTIESLFRAGNEFHIYGVHPKIEERIKYLFSEQHFPVPFKAVKQNLFFKQFKKNSKKIFGKYKISNCPQTHPGGSFAYSLSKENKKFVFSTDIELKKMGPTLAKYPNFYRDADLLIMDAHYSPEDITNKEGFGHSDIFNTVDFAHNNNCKKLVLFHQSPTFGNRDIQTQWDRAKGYLHKKYPKSKMEIVMAHDGLELSL